MRYRIKEEILTQYGCTSRAFYVQYKSVGFWFYLSYIPHRSLEEAFKLIQADRGNQDLKVVYHEVL